MNILEKSLGGGIQATLFDHLFNEGIGGILGFASARHARAPLCSEERITRLHKNPDTLWPLAKEMTFNQIRNYLSSIRVVYDSNGNCRWQEITKRQQQIAVRLGLSGVYDAVPTWAMK